MNNRLRKLLEIKEASASRYVGSSRLLALGFCSVLAAAAPALHAASATWIGASTVDPLSLNDAANWSTGSSTFVSGDVITFDNTTPLGQRLVWTAGLGQGFGATDGLHINYTGAGNLTLDNSTGDAGVFMSIGNITIAAGAGAFAIGDGVGASTMVHRGANGLASFTNNSSNTAVFGADALWRSGGAAARTITFDGTGDWRIDAPFRIDASQGQSGITVIKNGPATLTLNGANNFGGSGGGITVNQGIFAVGGAGFLGQGGNYAAPIAIVGGAFNYGGTGSSTLTGLISGAAPINQSAGTVVIANVSGTTPNTYTGQVTVTGGTFGFSGTGSLNSAAGITVNGATAVLRNNGTEPVTVPVSLRSGGLAGTGVINTVTVPNDAGATVSLAENVNIGSITFQGAAGLTVNKVALAPEVASVNVTGTLTTTPAAGKIRLNSSQPFWSSGVFYNLVQAGSLSGNAASFEVGTISGLTSRQSAQISVQGSSVGLTIAGDTPRWSGAGNRVWDTTATNNWALIIGGGATTFINGDLSRFDDTASSGAVTIGASGVQPSSVQFVNETLDYTVAGPGGITAGALTKSGSARVTISSPNTYAGGTTLSSGTLALSGVGTLGGPTAAVTITGGTLDLGGTAQTLGAVTVAGESSIINGDLSAVSLTGNGTVGAATVSARVRGSGSVVMNGAGSTLTLSGVNDYTGGTTITAGTLALAGSGTLGAASSPVAIAGGVLDLGGSTLERESISFTGAGTLQNGTLHNTNITATNTSGTAIVAAPITGSGSVSRSTSGAILALTGANTYTGATNSNAGTLQVGNNTETGSISPASVINVANGATFAVSRSNAAVQGVDFGVITGLGGFTKAGSGVTTLNVANTYVGTTNITGGTLEVTHPNALGTGPVNINGFGNRLHLTGGITLPNLINTGGGVTIQSTSGHNVIASNIEFANVGSVTTGISALVDTTLTIQGDMTVAAGLNWSTANRTFNFLGAGTTIVNGAIRNPAHATTTTSLVGVTKNGGGTTILRGTNPYPRQTFIYGGTLRIEGALTVDPLTAQASPVVVELDGTLSGTGTIAGRTEVYGRLRPSAGGAPGGKLTLENQLYLDLFSNTQFDITGVLFTGVASTLESGVAYGGGLRLNFTSGIYNGTYRLFELTGAPQYAFELATVTNSLETETPMTKSGSVWSLTSNNVTYAFDEATGTLTVSGGLNAVTPGSTGLVANAGTGVVNLSWSAATAADTYVLSRSTTAGGPYTVIANGLAGLSYADTAVENGVTYYYVITPRDSASGLTGPVSSEASATPVASVYTALQTWRFDNFGVHDDDANILAGDAEDFDGDGLSNLMEYALGTDPKVSAASPVTVAKVGNVLTLSYPRRSTADGNLAYVVEASDTLAGFAPGAGETVTVGNVSTYTDTVTLAGGVRRFLRLVVSYTPAQ